MSEASRIVLKQSPVCFNEVDHTYNLMGQSLSGVTSLLHRTLFADKYRGIDKSVLAKAAAYGHNIHEQIELVDTLGVESTTPAVQAYVAMRDALGLKVLANEDFTLADVKTTSRLDMEYLSWQLSIYAHLFERQNPTLRVPRLLAIWLPKPQYGKPNIIEVPRKSDDAVKVLISWDKSITQNNQYK